MKAILVINMPERCDDEQCLICYDSAMCSYLGRWMGNKTERPTDCPLRPLPEKDVVTEDDGFIYEDDLRMASYLIGYSKGRNEVINEITGEME